MDPSFVKKLYKEMSLQCIKQTQEQNADKDQELSKQHKLSKGDT